MIVQTDSTCIWAVYEWYCTRIFFCKRAKHVDRLFAKLCFFQNWVDCGWGLYRIICQEEIWELLKCCKGCFQNLGGCSFYMLTLVTAKLYPLFVICTWVHQIFQFSSPASRVSLSYQNVLHLDGDCTGKWCVHQECNRCSYAFCCSGLCGREHGWAPSVSLKSSCTAGAWWTIFVEVYFQQLFLMFCIASCEWSLCILSYLVVYKSWIERHLYWK